MKKNLSKFGKFFFSKMLHVLHYAQNMPQIYKATLLKSHFGMGVICKFAADFQNTFSYEHLWVAASVN